ncbi:hypothetical protein HDV00_002716 [Rhizophlyctis rosea]|nr:hypothetical protein HDV00_002716 [Rhizophlyctis rosea]
MVCYRDEESKELLTKVEFLIGLFSKVLIVCLCLDSIAGSRLMELLLDVTDDFTFGGGGEGVTTLGEDLHQAVGQVTAGKVETEDGSGELEVESADKR